MYSSWIKKVIACREGVNTSVLNSSLQPSHFHSICTAYLWSPSCEASVVDSSMADVHLKLKFIDTLCYNECFKTARVNSVVSVSAFPHNPLEKLAINVHKLFD